MSRTLITTVTEGQKKQLKRFAEDAIDGAIVKGLLDRDGIQKLIENGDEFQAHIVAGINELSVSKLFTDEEVRSSYDYPEGYKIKGLAEQVSILRLLFPWLGLADERLAEQSLPPNAEGWFAIPRWQLLGNTYNEAVENVLAMIRSRRKFYNYCVDQLGSAYLRHHMRTRRMSQRVGESQKDFDILVVPAQFGLRHKGCSVRRAREVFGTHEFGLGAFAVGIMLLTHPEREVQWEQLHVDCAGDEFAPEADGVFSYAPFFYFNGGKVRFGARWFDRADDGCGSASAFLPE